MFKSILISAVMLLLLAGLTYSQTDLAPDSKIIISGTEKTFPGDIVDSKVNTGKDVPQYLFDQLEIANETENLEEENRIMNIINTHYSEGVPANTTYGLMPDETSISGNNNPPYNPDWVSPDVLVWSGTGGSATRRTMDMKMGEDGNMYLAFCYNGSSHGIKIYRSTNWGLNWTAVHTLTGSSWYTGLSMTVERRHASNNDSIRVNVFFTYSTTGSNNDNGRLRLMSCRIGSGTGQNIFVNIDSPGSGNEYRWPSAVSNGAFYSTTTDIGVVLGEYNNAVTSEINLKYFYTSNMSFSFTEYTYFNPNEDYWLSAAYKDINGTDSLFIVSERRWGTQSQLRLIRTRFVGPTTSWPYTTITSGSGEFNREPSFNIPQRKFGCDKMMVTYTRRTNGTTAYGLPRYAYSNNGAASWSIGLVLGSSVTSRTTWLNSDTNQSGGAYYVSVFGDTDSLNVRRGAPPSMGTYYNKRNSNLVTGTYIPVCAVYTYWGLNIKRSAIAFWQSGPTNVYYDGENLPVGITNTNGIANTYSLSQNFPNPFNPTTTIKFSLPKDGLVKLVVYDVLGKEVATLVNDEQTKGNYQVTFNASKLTSGVYFYKITSGDFSDVKKMLLVK